MIFPNNQLLKISMYMASTVGIWPLIFTENRRLKKIYNIFGNILFYYLLEFVLRAYYQLSVLLRAEHLNVEELLRNVCITLIYTMSLFRQKAFNTNKLKTLFGNIVRIEQEIMSDDDYKIKKIYMSYVRNNMIYNILFLFNGWMVSVFYFLHPFFMELPTMVVANETITLRTFPVSTWWPINAQERFWLAYCWSVFDGMVGCSFVINTDILTFSLIVFALSQLKILGYRLRNFKYEMPDEIVGVRNRDEYFREKFVYLIKEHKKIINYIDTFNETMRYAMLFDFLQSSVQLATIILQLVLMEINAENVLFAGQFMITMLIRLVIYYYNANEVIYLSKNLAADVWQTDWYKQNKEIKNMVTFFIARAQRPLKFQIGPFGVMSLETLIAILKATYSYLMLFINTGR